MPKTFHILLTVLSYSLLSFFASAQPPVRPNNGNLSIGHFYGKIIDSATNKPLSGATIQLLINQYDSSSKKTKEKIIRTLVSEQNGDFSLIELPINSKFQLKISSIGYAKLVRPLSFQRPTTKPKSGSPAESDGRGMSSFDIDLGNIRLSPQSDNLSAVTVKATQQLMSLGVDRKIFNVEKNINSVGQTATEVMKSIPLLNVDADGNLSLRNSTPTILVDGRPTTLTLDQIPADIIEKVELVTNPSAKYDASGGNAGIVNIILKKNKAKGYNGNLRGGIDSRWKVNAGGDFNYKMSKINIFASTNFFQRKFITTNNTNTDYSGNTPYHIVSNSKTNNYGFVLFQRLGMDYFLDNRNTLSFAGNIGMGRFNGLSSQLVDSSLSVLVSTNNRNTDGNFRFNTIGGQLSFKHNFAKERHFISADANYNARTNRFGNDISNLINSHITNLQYPAYKQSSSGSAENKNITFQTDYENPITENTKLELGLKGNININTIKNFQSVGSDTGKLILSPKASNNYTYTEQLYAAYGTYSFKVKKTGFMLGLRAENYSYKGNLDKLFGGDSINYKINYPISLFPSVFISHKLNDKQDLQFNYSRRINRPNFFQTLPAYNFNDPQNPSVGNPNLKPEFTSSFELNYMNSFTKTTNLLATVYLKYTDNLITRYIYKDINRYSTSALTTDSLYYTSYTNANVGMSYGAELTGKTTLLKWWDLMLNLNVYNADLKLTIPGQSLNSSQFSFYGKLTSIMKIAKGWTVQINTDARSKTLIPQGGNTGGFGRGGFMGGGIQTNAQGYTLPRLFDTDVSIRKEITMKKGQAITMSLSISDIFRTPTRTYTQTDYFVQNTTMYRDSQVLRLNLNYRFGKIDANLSKRKNNKTERGGDMEIGM